MPKPEDYKRVKLDASGTETTVLNVRDGMTVLDKAATDKNGLPLPPKPKTTVRQAAAKKTAKKTTAGKKSASKTDTAPVTSTASGDTAAATSKEDSK